MKLRQCVVLLGVRAGSGFQDESVDIVFLGVGEGTALEGGSEDDQIRSPPPRSRAHLG